MTIINVSYQPRLYYNITVSVIVSVSISQKKSSVVRFMYDAGRFFFRDDGCDGKTTLGVTAELHYEQNVDVYVGMPCSSGPHTLALT